ncbi:hypothetical protein PC129_g11874 [Phytophthora cactorum]|uniref:Uncharacterized protein n=4 Tax=Phytophthora cactorum TaxID=29920 RepID=A0A8T1HXL9_9STRA|nr:hypothetical protein Pcac1_g11605 [Phytophthora cactorum]KAG3188371.1 hypothetical protein C6341_g2814 [Phytophthora cactorum]KAG3217300.1 hypothetical protein PC129_g11874 [Phytophthora cactorum]
MVLTRAQQAAREATEVFDEDMENTESVEPEDVAETSETAMVAHVEEAPSAVAKAPNVGDQLVSLAHHLLQRTQSLAAEHVALQHQQQGQNDAQNAALMAMYALTETSVKNLTDQQRVIVENLGEALNATHTGLQEQFKRMQMVHDEQGGHIERFVNERLTQALQEVQRESKACKLATSSQAEDIQRRLQEVTTKVDGGLEQITRQIQQLVESKLAASQKQLCLGQEASELVQQQVQAASEGVATAIKSSLEMDLQRACETMRQELLQTVNRAEEPLRESARALVLEIAAITERQLEARMQKAITNTQSELNLEVQRQADATSSLREQVRNQGIRINKQSKQARQQGDSELEATIAEMVQKEVQERLNAVQQTRKIIDRSIQSAVDAICKTIKDEVREVTARAAQPKPQVSSVNHANATKDDKSDGDDEDHELERRMQKAWRKTYLVESSSVSQPEASTDQEPSKEIVRVSQSSTCSTDNKSSGEIIAVSPRSSAHREVDREMETEEKLPASQEVTIVLQESSTPVVGGVVLTQPNQTQ